MLDLGLILTVLGVLLALPIVWVVGLVLVVVGALRWVASSARDSVGVRRHFS